MEAKKILLIVGLILVLLLILRMVKIDVSSTSTTTTTNNVNRRQVARTNYVAGPNPVVREPTPVAGPNPGRGRF